MRNRFPASYIFLACSLVAFDASGAVIFDNGGPDQGNAFEMTEWIDANQFSVGSTSALTGLTFWDLEPVQPLAASVTWQIYANSASNTPGDMLFSGTSTITSHAATGLFVYGTYPEYLSACDLPGVSLPPGRYWFALHNGPISNDAYGYVFWETTTNSSTAASLSDIAPFHGDWQSNSSPDDPNSQLAFQLSGVPEAWRARVTSVAVTGGATKITFNTALNQHYRVDYKNQLTDSAWTPLSNGMNISGNGGSVTVMDNGAAPPSVTHRFYRVVLLM